MSNESNLIDLILEERIRGLSYFKIEQKHGIAAIEARQLVREALSSESIDDEWEKRGITMLRIERVIEHLWEGVENGSFKHAEALFKGIERLAELLALNKEVMEDQRAMITDEQASVIYAVIVENNRRIYNYIEDKLRPTREQELVLSGWPTVASEAATEAIEAVIYEDEDEIEEEE